MNSRDSAAMEVVGEQSRRGAASRPTPSSVVEKDCRPVPTSTAGPQRQQKDDPSGAAHREHVDPPAPPPPAASSPLEAGQYQVYSAVFQCFVGLPFYASLMLELQSMARAIDDRPAAARRAVWCQLLTLISPTRTLPSSSTSSSSPSSTAAVPDAQFGPVVAGWLAGTTTNLLAVELLYLAFMLALLKYPDLLDDRPAIAAATAYAAAPTSAPVSVLPSSVVTTLASAPAAIPVINTSAGSAAASLTAGVPSSAAYLHAPHQNVIPIGLGQYGVDLGALQAGGAAGGIPVLLPMVSTAAPPGATATSKPQATPTMSQDSSTSARSSRAGRGSEKGRSRGTSSSSASQQRQSQGQEINDMQSSGYARRSQPLTTDIPPAKSVPRKARSQQSRVPLPKVLPLSSSSPATSSSSSTTRSSSSSSNKAPTSAAATTSPYQVVTTASGMPQLLPAMPLMQISLPNILQQLSVLQTLTAELDDLPLDQKNLLWQMCESFAQWGGQYYRDSFRNTFDLWASDIASHAMSIWIFFSVISALRSQSDPTAPPTSTGSRSSSAQPQPQPQTQQQQQQSYSMVAQNQQSTSTSGHVSHMPSTNRGAAATSSSSSLPFPTLPPLTSMFGPASASPPSSQQRPDADFVASMRGSHTSSSQSPASAGSSSSSSRSTSNVTLPPLTFPAAWPATGGGSAGERGAPDLIMLPGSGAVGLFPLPYPSLTPYPPAQSSESTSASKSRGSRKH